MAERKKIRQIIYDLLFPPRCASCRTLLDWYREDPDTGETLCRRCQAEWEEAKRTTCEICGKPVPECRCMPILMQEARCRGFCRLVFYSPRQDDAVQNRIIYHIKRRQEIRAPEFLCRELLPALEQILGDKIAAKRLLVTYIPRRRNAKTKYGVDQAELLAKAMAKLTGGEFRRLIRRTRGSTQAQKFLSPEKRLENAKQAFVAGRMGNCRGRTVLLLDDLVTTGASMERCVRILYQMGAGAVYCASVATDIPDPAETVQDGALS